MARTSVRRGVPTREFTNRLNDSTITAMWSGGSLIVSIVLLTAVGYTGLYFGRALGDVQGSKVGLLLGLAVGMIVIGLLLTVNSVRIRARSANLYRGIWVGLVLALVLLLIMAFAPQLIGAAPPPGQNPGL